MASTRANHRRRHRRGRPGDGGMRRQLVLHRRLTEWVNQPSVGRRLLRLHAVARPAELPRPRQQRCAPEDQRSGTWGQQLPVSSGRNGLPAPAAERRRVVPTANRPMHRGQRLPTSLGTADSQRPAELRRCMRSHGFPSWPDPTIDSQGTPFSTSARPALARLLPGPRSGRRPTVDVSAS
jgi:hypothetical protein